VVSLYLFSISFSLSLSQQPQIGCLPYFNTWYGLSVNLECRSEIYCMQLAGNTGRKKLPSWHHNATIAQLCRAVSSQLKHVSTIGKNWLNSNTSSTCPRNMVNFGPLTAEIGLGFLGTPANFNRFHVLAALLHSTRVVGMSQTLLH